MKSKNVAVNRMFFLLVFAFFLVLFSYTIYCFATGKLSFSALDGWDGVTVAESFASGNGTKENPYIISNAEEYMYFQSMIEGDSHEAYEDKYYALSNNIDFNNHAIAPIGVASKETVGEVEVNKEYIFRGTFDGNGYTLSNFKITEPKVFGENKYYTLFAKVEEGSIYRMNLDLYEIDTTEDSNAIVSGLVGDIKKGTIEDISLLHFDIDGTKGENVNVGVIAGTSDEESTFRNIYIDGKVNTGEKIHYLVDGKVTNLISNLEFNGEIENGIESFYENKDGKFFIGEEEITVEDLLKSLNEKLEEPYSWKYENDVFLFYTSKLDEEIEEVEEVVEPQNFAFSVTNAPAISLHDTGTEGTSVYINDLVSDYNYYIGRNYTEISDSTGVLPNGTNRGIYSDSNLATIYIRYNSGDINDDQVYGTVSASEGYRDFYYYKRYPVVDGYVEFDLIDNPWANRPANRAFNGWVTDNTDAVVSLDIDTYTRKVRIKVDDVATPISITFYSSWTYATIATTTDEINNLKPAVMQELPKVAAETLTNYYYESSVAFNDNYPDSNNLYSLDGVKINASSRCNVRSGCNFVDKVTDNNYNASTRYYTVVPKEDGSGYNVDPYYPMLKSIPYYDDGVAAGYFIKATAGDNLYNNNGEKINYCSDANCYRLMQYRDGAINHNETYYYLATRDTNIFAPTTTDTINSSDINTSKPMTITGLNANVDGSDSHIIYLDRDWTMNADIRIEYIKMYGSDFATSTNPTDDTTSDINNGREIYGNFHNLKIGRGLKQYDDNYSWIFGSYNRYFYNASSFIGGSNDSTRKLEKYTLIVESGTYQNGAGVGHSSTGNHFVNANVILGSDFDRVSGNNNSLMIYYCYAGTWASNLYSRDSYNNTYDIPAILTTIKSGHFGANEGDYAAGVYVGGRAAGSHYALREVVVEGGIIFNLIGGPMSNNDRSGKNDVILNVKGGNINMIFGGAGASNTVGNRILNITGGVVQYSVLGGSNAYRSGASSNPYGKIDGDTLIYVGGNATIGNKTDSLYNVSSGNVFGAGNGRSGELDVGSVNNSNVIVAPSATIKGSVYGGGNFGAVGGNTVGTSDFEEGNSNDKDVYEDGTVDNNIRYYGANPDNYVTFGGNTFRIVGLFNNVETPDGNKNLVRIIRNSNYGSYVWGDSNDYGLSQNGRNYYYTYYNYFTNTDNRKSNIYTVLNSNFYNDLNETDRNYIQTATWHYGALDSANHPAGYFYTAERGNTPSYENSKTSDSFNVGLYYASDYGFASSSSGCLASNLSGYNGVCSSSNWMNNILSNNAWSMSLSTNYSRSNRGRRYYYGYQVFTFNQGRIAGYAVNNNDNYRSADTFPSFYLKENVTISGGTGTADDPYVIGAGTDKLKDIVYKKMYPDPVEVEEPTTPEDDGNYQESTDYQDRTHIHVIGGTIEGSVFGAGNNNGAGNFNGSKVAYAKITIDVDGGIIKDSIYGGSNEKGTVYGDVLLNINNGTINGSVYGGGKGGYVSDDESGTYVSRNVDVNIGNASTANLSIGNNVYGGSAFGSVNGTSQESVANENHVRVKVNAGTINGDVFGGGQGNGTYTPYEYGNVYVHINGGNMSRVFGGNDSSGQPSNGDIVYLNGGTIGNAFGGGNNTGQDSTDIRLLGSTITGNLYGGSNQSGNVKTSHVTVSNGKVTDIYGGNNLAGSTLTTNIIFSNCEINGNVYGGGNQAESNETNVVITGGILKDVFGGGNQAGVSNSTNVTVLSGSINHLFGGSNKSGDVGDTNINVVDSYTDRGVNTSVQANLIFDDKGTSWVDNNMKYIGIYPKIENLSAYDYTEWTAKITVPGSSLFPGFDFLNSPLVVDNGTYTFSQVNKYDSTKPFILTHESVTQIPGYFAIHLPLDVPFELKFELFATNSHGDNDYFVDNYMNGTKVVDLNKGINYIFGGNNEGGTTNSSTINVTAGTIGEIYGGGNKVGVPTTNVNVNGGNTTSVFGGSNETGDVNTSNVKIGVADPANPEITNVYGGNNAGGITTQTNVTMKSGTVNAIFGGGNNADVTKTNVVVEGGTTAEVYGGGNAASVQQNSLVDVNGGTIAGNLYGGGNQGTVQQDTNVTVTNGIIKGNAFAGGNGATAIVHGNSTITIDGATVIGVEGASVPNAGCVFGSGNAASTGINGGSSKGTVNIVGGEIYGNVYGGPKMAVVYGTTETNIGTSAVSISDLTEDDIVIHGTVFGGGESNASGEEDYDYTFISVTEGITVNIDGTGYIDHAHDFIIKGSIFGSGNASSSSGESNVNIKNLGSKEKPNQSISIQRATNLVIDSSVIELFGTTDRTNEYSDFLYSLNLIDKMIITNNTTLFLQHNANMLKELYSGVGTGSSLTKATVEINDDSKTVTKNVDNRIYMLPGENLHVTVNQAASAYGKVNGMTFFGMYVPIEGGGYRLGLYDSQYDYGDSANAGLEIVGGSYVIGLHYVNHDITKDGFYTNVLDSNSFSEIVTQYINPSEIGEDGYRWTVGFETIDYKVYLTISKYSSMGTADLLLGDFSHGDSKYEIIGFDVSELESDVSLVDSNSVPRFADTEEEANSILGLSMKAETQEWITPGTTKFLSRDGGAYTGETSYMTDSRNKAPHLMFYTYHAKNFNREGDLGKAVVMMQVTVPKNEIEYDIKFLTITVFIDAKNYDDEPYYDASITYNRKYEMPAATDVNITNQSQFTAYFSLNEMYDSITAVYGLGVSYYRALVFTSALPVNTMITMLDYGANDNRPDYYYYKITQEDHDAMVAQLEGTQNEASLRINKFIKMDSTSTNNTYNDTTANYAYYDPDTKMTDEEFIFIFDFKETNVTGDHLNNHISFELRNLDDWYVINVVGVRSELMYYSTYESSNVVLEQKITDIDDYLYYNVADEFHYATNIRYNETENRQAVIDTNYENNKMGLNVEFFTKSGTQVSSSMLVGTNITIGGQEYYADGNGIFRIKLTDKVSTIERNATIVPARSLPAGDYKVRFTVFASEDGLHNPNYSEDGFKEFSVTVVPDESYIAAECDDTTKLVYGETGLNHAGTNINTYKVKYNAVLTNPNFRVEVMKRDTTNVNTVQYRSIPFNKLFTNELSKVGTGNEVVLPVTDTGEQSFDFTLADNLDSGTYRVIFKLYDSNQLIDDDTKYVIVQKKID